MTVDCIGVERFYAHTEVIHIERLRPRRGAAHASEFPIHWHEIDERTSGAQLDQAEIILAFLDVAAEHVAVEACHFLGVDDAEHHVIDFANADHDLRRAIKRRA